MAAANATAADTVADKTTCTDAVNSTFVDQTMAMTSAPSTRKVVKKKKPALSAKEKKERRKVAQAVAVALEVDRATR